jgi:hypothetical protein
MNLLADEGIYVAVDVGTRWIALNRENEWAVNASYNDDYLQRIFATTEMFSKYDNTLLFFAGNEVIDKKEVSWSAPYIKAVVRDTKRYLKERGLRQVPVGYAATDTTENVFELGEYLNCGSERSDFFAINDYSWCHPSSFERSGWINKVAKWKNYAIPLLYDSHYLVFYQTVSDMTQQFLGIWLQRKRSNFRRGSEPLWSPDDWSFQRRSSLRI